MVDVPPGDAFVADTDCKCCVIILKTPVFSSKSVPIVKSIPYPAAWIAAIRTLVKS